MGRRAPRHLDVDADLTLRTDDHRVEVTGAGRRLRVDAPTMRSGLALARRLDDLPVSRRRLAVELVRADLVLDVTVRGATVARIGAGVRPGIVSRLLGVEPARVRLRGLLELPFRV